MKSLSEALGSLKKDERSIVQRRLDQKVNLFNQANLYRPDAGWAQGSREWNTEQRLLGDLDKFHRKHWKTVGPRGPMTPLESQDKNWWKTRANLATKAYNKAYDDLDAFMKKPTVTSQRLQLKISKDLEKRRDDLASWYDAISDKDYETEVGKMKDAYTKGLTTVPSSRRKAYDAEHERQLKLKELEYSKNKTSLRAGQLGREVKKPVKESIMKKPKLKVQLSEKKDVTKGSTYMIDPTTGGEAKMPKPKKPQVGPQPAPVKAKPKLAPFTGKADKGPSMRPAPKGSRLTYAAPSRGLPAATSWVNTAGPAVTPEGLATPFIIAGSGGRFRGLGRNLNLGRVSGRIKPATGTSRVGSSRPAPSKPAPSNPGPKKGWGTKLKDALKTAAPYITKAAKGGAALAIRAGRYTLPPLRGGRWANLALKALGDRKAISGTRGAAKRYVLGQGTALGA